MSSDEGEIIEATTLPRPEQNGGVDRKGRNRGRLSRSPESEILPHNSRDDVARRSRSPRGFKRSRDDRDRESDRDRDRDRRDPRHFRVFYESASRDDNRRGRDVDDRPPSRGSYRDLDRPVSRSTNSHHYGHDTARHRQRPNDFRSSRDYDRDYDGCSDKRFRNRSRSPRSQRDRGRRDRDRSDRDPPIEQSKYNATHKGTISQPDSISKRAVPEDNSLNGKRGAKSEQDVSDKADSRRVAFTEDTRNNDAQNDVDNDWEPEPIIDEEAAIEAEIQRRKRAREEALKRARSNASTPNIQTLQVSDKPGSTPGSTRFSTPVSNLQRTGEDTPHSGAGNSPTLTPNGAQDGSTPASLNIADDQDLINTHAESKLNDEDGPSAADYDPTIDMQEDERRHELRHRHPGELHGHQQSAPEVPVIQSVEDDAPENKEDEDDDFDMFADDIDETKFPAAAKSDASKSNQMAQVNGGGILEGDDKDGYYKIRPGEILDGRYQISTTLGRGMFSGVARAVDLTTKNVVAIKIMRNNDALKKGGYTEIAILQKLNSADPDNKKHIVKFERWFEYKGHLCMVFENLSLNLREVLKKFGNNVGINLRATRIYAQQIFIALAHMRKCSIVHADLKPDNILVNENRSILKICDLGTAINRSDAATASTEITPYLVSRFYRAPEIILGMPYDYAVDMWSIGCTLYELYTGKILFTGDSNNQMLKTIMEIRGKLSPKLYRRGQLASMHFDELGNFISVERDKILGKTAVRTLAVVKPTRDLRTRLFAASSGMDDAETRELNSFVDLLERCLALNPDKRITPSDALRHPFFAAATKQHLPSR